MDQGVGSLIGRKSYIAPARDALIQIKGVTKARRSAHDAHDIITLHNVSMGNFPFRRQAGKHLLVLSFTASEPETHDRG